LCVGEELAIDGVGDAPLEAAQRFECGLAGRELAPVVGRPGVSRRIWLIAAMWSMWFIRRFPARERRCRFCSPEEASRGAVPVQDAKRLRSANRAMSPTSANVRAATTGPTPGRSISREPRALTRALSSVVALFIFASTATRSASSSAAILRRDAPMDVKAG